MAGQARSNRKPTSRTTEPKTDPDLVWANTHDLTAGEIEAVEEAAGVSITDFGQVDKAQGKLSRAIGWVFRLRTDPDLAFEGKTCARGARPQCGDCHCARRLKVMYVQGEAPTPPPGGNGS